MNALIKMSAFISVLWAVTSIAQADGPVTSGNLELSFPLTLEEGAPEEGLYNKTLHYDFDTQYIEQSTIAQDEAGQSFRRVVRVNCGQVATRMVKYLIYREMVREDLGNGYRPYVFRNRPNRYRQAILAYNLGTIRARASHTSYANSTRIETAEGQTLSFGNIDINYHPIAATYQYRPESCGGAIDCEFNLQIYYCGLSELGGNMSQAFNNLIESVAASQEGVHQENLAARQRTRTAGVGDATDQAIITTQSNDLINEEVPAPAASAQ